MTDKTNIAIGNLINIDEVNKTVAELQTFWRELARCLKDDPSSTAVADLLDRYQHLAPWISDDVEEHCALLYRARRWLG